MDASVLEELSALAQTLFASSGVTSLSSSRNRLRKPLLMAPSICMSVSVLT